jgi:hypothetical protein
MGSHDRARHGVSISAEAERSYRDLAKGSRRPENDISFVYTHNWHEVLTLGERRLVTLDNRLVTKLVYTLGF